VSIPEQGAPELRALIAKWRSEGFDASFFAAELEAALTQAQGTQPAQLDYNENEPGWMLFTAAQSFRFIGEEEPPRIEGETARVRWNPPKRAASPQAESGPAASDGAGDADD
jgi:hypothetical protein